MQWHDTLPDLNQLTQFSPVGPIRAKVTSLSGNVPIVIGHITYTDYARRMLASPPQKKVSSINIHQPARGRYVSFLLLSMGDSADRCRHSKGVFSDSTALNYFLISFICKTYLLQVKSVALTGCCCNGSIAADCKGENVANEVMQCCFRKTSGGNTYLTCNFVDKC